MTTQQGLYLFSVAFAAGALNSVAGGGSFISFPALVFAGVPPITANATNTFALWPGTAASTAAYRGELAGYRRMMLPLIGTGIVGGVVGALLLLHTPQATFMRMIPWLLLAATLLLAFSGNVARLIGVQALCPNARTSGVRWAPQVYASGPSRRRILQGAILQLLIAVYIGFFGAGAGIMMLAMFALMGITNIHAMNGLKTLLATVCNGVAIVAFIAARAILWPQALLMTGGAILGGYGGAWFAQKIPARYVRWFAIAVGAGMTTYFFVRTA
jgi:uncharacterized protein